MESNSWFPGLTLGCFLLLEASLDATSFSGPCTQLDLWWKTASGSWTPHFSSLPSLSRGCLQSFVLITPRFLPLTVLYPSDPDSSFWLNSVTCLAWLAPNFWGNAIGTHTNCPLYTSVFPFWKMMPTSDHLFKPQIWQLSSILLFHSTHKSHLSAQYCSYSSKHLESVHFFAFLGLSP